MNAGRASRLAALCLVASCQSSRDLPPVLAEWTVVPTSDVPTSDAPTRDLPTSDAPTGDAPTGDAPTGDAPTVAARCGWFREATAASGVRARHVPTNYVIDGNGVGVGDLDGDGDLDLVVTGGVAGVTQVFRNDGGWRFTAGESLGAGIAVGLGDLDRDGDLDLVLTLGRAQRVLENVGALRFVGRAELPTFGDTPDQALAVLPADFDRDGDLDVYVGQRASSSFFRNDGAWRFVDATEAWGATHQTDGIPYTPTYFDATGDGAPDLYLPLDTDALAFGVDAPAPLDRPGDRLLVTGTSADGGLQLRDEALARGFAGARSGMGVVLGDFNDDARLDVYLSNIGANPLFVAQGDGTFRPSTTHDTLALTRAARGECAPGSPDRECLVASWGSALFDVDLDGDDDLVVTNDLGRFAEEDAYFERLADRSWRRVESCTALARSNGLVAADLDDDGDLDLVKTANGGDVTLYRNEARGGARPLRVTLRGSRSNRDGVGALVTLVRSDGRRVARAVGAGGSPFCASPVEANFTLGPTDAASVEVRWPSGARQTVEVPAGARRLRVDEPS